MMELCAAVGLNPLQGHGAAPSSCGSDQKPCGQVVGVDRRLPSQKFSMATAQPIATSPPSYPETVLAINTEVPFAEEDGTHAARPLGHICQFLRDPFLEPDSGWMRNANEQPSRRRRHLSAWGGWCHQCSLQWKKLRRDRPWVYALLICLAMMMMLVLTRVFIDSFWVILKYQPTSVTRM